MSNKIKTKYGTAILTKKGYYRISSRKEGNHGKMLHRLIWEEHNGNIPQGYVIHHKNKIRTDNNIKNLVLITKKEHDKLTQYENSKSKNTTRYFRVSKKKDNHCKQGFRYRYRYYDKGRIIDIYSIDIKKLEKKVKDKGLDWIKF